MLIDRWEELEPLVEEYHWEILQRAFTEPLSSHARTLHRIKFPTNPSLLLMEVLNWRHATKELGLPTHDRWQSPTGEIIHEVTEFQVIYRQLVAKGL